MANPAATLAKWKRNAAASVDDYKNGVKAVTTSPTAKAAAAVDKYARGIQEAVSSGRYVNSLNAVTLQDWQQATADKGARNFATGVSSISPRAQKAMADQQAYAESVKQQIAAMPNNTEAEAEARMLAAVRLMKAYKTGRMG